VSKAVFFGYPRKPRAIAEVMKNFAAGIRKMDDINATTWEDLRPDGIVVIDEVLGAIDHADMSIFDLTYPNPNVLFELGYAISRAKRVWITLDATVQSASRSWVDLALLNQVGYTAYRNSDELVSRFQETRPVDGQKTIYDSLLQPVLPEVRRPRDGVLYCATFEPFEAANKLNSLVDSRQRRGERFSVSDPAESGLATLNWFVPRIVESAGVMVNFSADYRNRAQVHNNRHALIAGMAAGFEIPVLLLAEQDYSAPFDYADRLQVYEVAEECLAAARTWLSSLSPERPNWSRVRPASRSPLAALRFGEHVAENEREELVDYFIETSAFHEIIAARDSIFIGHRGTGKTANAIQAFNRIAANKTNLAILIKPPSFEFPAILDIVGRLPEFQHDYFFDALWRFVIQTEIASSVYQRLNERSSGVPYSQEEESFLEYVEAAEFDLKADASIRLEQALHSLSGSLVQEVSGSNPDRNQINEAFHRKSLAALRAQLGKVLRDRKRVAVFVDNLDKGWEQGADFSVMARFILGLLTARGQVVTDFGKDDHWRDSVKLTVAVFLRSDIYTYLRKEAREPDKLPISTVKWDDWASLRKVLESRFAFSGVDQGDGSDLWENYFCREVDGTPLQDFLKKVTLPRPRDIVFFCNSAVGRAIDRGHDRVLEEDFVSALSDYSQYAYEALLVENGVTVPEMEDALLGFLDASEVATYSERVESLRGAGIAESRVDVLIQKLISMSFLGLEVRPSVFVYPEVGTAMSAAIARAQKLQQDRADQRLSVHSAFHDFLEIQPAN
jgi:hypothetical protein